MTQVVPQETLDKFGVDADIYLALKSSIFPGAKDESIMMAVSYCRAAKLDVIQKPVHIVPMQVKNSQTGHYEWRDIVMPGIALYRTQAARSGCYAGKMEPEYGPDVTETVGGTKVTYPQWCKVIIRKVVNGHVCEFAAKEFWKENYASTKEGRPNAMWQKRPYAQLAKCTEAQALRMAFPELCGGMPTAEEMEGKIIEGTYGLVEPQKMLDSNDTIDQEQISSLLARILETETKVEDVLAHLKIEKLADMRFKDYQQVSRQLERKIQKRKKAESLEINKMFEEPKDMEALRDEVLDVLDQ